MGGSERIEHVAAGYFVDFANTHAKVNTSFYSSIRLITNTKSELEYSRFRQEKPGMCSLLIKASVSRGNIRVFEYLTKLI